MNTKRNQKFIESEKKIEEALFKLSKNKSIEEVSVLSICKEASINPSTFYAHYEDIYDLVKQLSKKYTEEMMEDEKNNEETDSYIFSKKSIFIFLRHIKKYKEFYSISLHTRKEFPIQEGYDYLLYIIRDKCKKKGITDENEILYYLVGYQSSFTMLLKRWVDQDCKESIDKMADIIYHCLPDVLKETL